MIPRRQFITLLGGAAAAWPLAAHAQQGERMRRIGLLMPLTADDPVGQARIAALREGLEKLGWTEGRNIRTGLRKDSTLIGPCPGFTSGTTSHRHPVHGFGPRQDARGTNA
jgi:hypothetical protein